MISVAKTKKMSEKITEIVRDKIENIACGYVFPPVISLSKKMEHTMKLHEDKIMLWHATVKTSIELNLLIQNLKYYD
jgi:hypothetical protein